MRVSKNLKNLLHMIETVNGRLARVFDGTRFGFEYEENPITLGQKPTLYSYRVCGVEPNSPPANDIKTILSFTRNLREMYMYLHGYYDCIHKFEEVIK